MICPKCKCQKSTVIRTEKYDTCVLRTRACLNPTCKHVWKTDEIITSPNEVAKAALATR